MALQKEVWAADIKGKLFPDDSFTAQSVDHSMWVDNKTVHSPEEGQEPEIEVDGGTFPMQVTNRDDVDNTYNLRNYRTKPIFIDDVDATEVSYDKRNSVLRQHTNVLNRSMANWMMYDWAATLSGNIVRTTGANRTAIASNQGATGNRKKIEIAQVQSLSAMFDDMDLSAEGRNLLLPSAMYWDLVNDNWKDLVSLQATGESVVKNGELLMLFGWKIWKRGSKNTLNYTNAATPVPRAPNAAGLTSANAAALAWHRDWVARARGSVDIYFNEKDATYQGDIISARVRAGGRKLMSDGTGVAAIVEAA